MNPYLNKYYNNISDPSIDTTSYALPEITSITTSNGGEKLDPQGETSNTITFHGKNLGNSDEWQSVTNINLENARIDFVGLARLHKTDITNTYRASVFAFYVGSYFIFWSCKLDFSV